MADGATFGVEVLAPESALFAGEASAVILRTSDGDLTVLAGHTPLVGDIVPGVVRVERDGETDAYCVHGGFLQVRTERGAARGLIERVDPEERTTRVTILAGVAEPVADIDVARAQAARDAATAALAELPGEDVDEAQAAQRHHLEGALARAELRLQSAGVTTAQ